MQISQIRSPLRSQELASSDCLLYPFVHKSPSTGLSYSVEPYVPKQVLRCRLRSCCMPELDFFEGTRPLTKVVFILHKGKAKIECTPWEEWKLIDPCPFT